MQLIDTFIDGNFISAGSCKCMCEWNGARLRFEYSKHYSYSARSNRPKDEIPELVPFISLGEMRDETECRKACNMEIGWKYGMCLFK